MTGTPSDGALREAELATLAGYRLAQAEVATGAVFMREVGEPLALRPVEFTLLVLLQANPGAGAAQLARALAITQPHMTLYLNRLAERALVKREPSAHDGRVTGLHLTRAGTKLAAEGLRRLQLGEREAFATRLSGVEFAMLLELLGKLSRPADRARKAGVNEALQ